MREIRFRGLDATGRKGWVYGDLVHNKKVTLTGLEDRVMVGGYEVIQESVGQKTGLVDYVGNDVYEGDILRIHVDRERVGAVEYNPYYGCYVLKNGTSTCTLFFFRPCDVEIIGNKYENSDLLDKQLTKTRGL